MPGISLTSWIFFHIILTSIAVVTIGQQPGTSQPENHPLLNIQSCSKNGGCITENKSIVLDANWRSIPSVSKNYQTCYLVLNNEWNTTLCPNGIECAQNCALDGTEYQYEHSITTSGSSLNLEYATYINHFFNIGSRVFLLEDENNYKLFKLKNREFTFDVNVSNLPCGLNGALYFVEMDANGGMSKFSGNKAGAKYGTGYCNAQCPHSVMFINGEANCEDWNIDNQTGHYGSCCNEMDIWQSNKISSTYVPHVCTVQGQTRCEGITCGDDANGQRYSGVCDKDGCDFNPYRLGNKTFFGPFANKTVDSTKPFTVVTQFITADGNDNSDLSEIRRIWIQNGNIIQNSAVMIGDKKYDSITDIFCDAQKKEFNNPNYYEKVGGNKAMGEALDRGMVLAMSILDDPDYYMLWLDSSYPPDQSSSIPGVARGTCDISSGRPGDVFPLSDITFSNIKYGDIGSTYRSIEDV